MNGDFAEHVLGVNQVVTLCMGTSVYQVFYLMETEGLTDALQNLNGVRFKVSHDSNKMAMGSGAIRQFASRCFRELVEDEHLLTNGLTVFLNPKSEFWDHDMHLTCFANLILIIKENDGILPYHLSPIMLSMFYQEDPEISKLLQLDEASVEYFLKHNNASLLDSINKDEHLDATLEELGCKTKLEYMILSLDEYAEVNTFKYVTIGDAIPEWTDERYQITNLIDLDEYFSGLFVITPEKILEITTVTCDKCDIEKYFNIDADSKLQTNWKNFVTSLTEKEIRCMLRSWTSDTKVDKPISIEVNFHQDEDIIIQTCFRKVKITYRIFFYPEKLDNLRKTFIDNVDEEMTD